MANLLRAHAAAYRVIHQLQPEARVGMAVQFRDIKPRQPWSPLDRFMASNANKVLNIPFPSALATGVMSHLFGRISVPEAKGTQDYFGFNYYTRNFASFDITAPGTVFTRPSYAPDDELSDHGFLANVPESMFACLEWIVRTFPKLPIIVSENGVNSADDRIRPRYIAQHVHQMWRAVNFNWPVKGYFHWSLVDNFEWDAAWKYRFGLWGLDVETQKRIKRPSVDLYEAICRENGLSSEMVQKYCPEVFEKIFPS
jgi:beta-glucosidase